MKINFDPRHTPTHWIHQILEAPHIRLKSVVGSYLVGATLRKQYAASKTGDFLENPASQLGWEDNWLIVGSVAYHVLVAIPTPEVVQRCKEQIENGVIPVLLVPNELVSKTRYVAEYVEIDKVSCTIGIEDFITCAIINMAIEQQTEQFEVLSQIIRIYNRLVEKVRTDTSLKIEAE